jgi:hypothetical protein
MHRIPDSLRFNALRRLRSQMTARPVGYRQSRNRYYVAERLLGAKIRFLNALEFLYGFALGLFRYFTKFDQDFLVHDILLNCSGVAKTPRQRGENQRRALR